MMIGSQKKKLDGQSRRERERENPFMTIFRISEFVLLPFLTFDTFSFLRQSVGDSIS